MEDPSTLDLWKKYVDVNLTGNFVLSQAVIPYMKVENTESKQKLPGSEGGAAGPCILNISSFRGLISDPNQEGYAATKGMFLLPVSELVLRRFWMLFLTFLAQLA